MSNEKPMFEMGDQVQLKSGGQKMTVIVPSEYWTGLCVCGWFEGSKYQKIKVNQNVLKRAEE